MKLILLIGILFIFPSNSIEMLDDKIIRDEAEYYCKCSKELDRKKKIFDKETRRKIKEDEKRKKYTPGMKLFGGYEFTFSFKECLGQKRSELHKEYIASIRESEQQYKNFVRRVKIAVRRNCSNVSTKYY